MKRFKTFGIEKRAAEWKLKREIEIAALSSATFFFRPVPSPYFFFVSLSLSKFRGYECGESKFHLRGQRELSAAFVGTVTTWSFWLPFINNKSENNYNKKIYSNHQFCIKISKNSSRTENLNFNFLKKSLFSCI